MMAMFFLLSLQPFRLNFINGRKEKK